VRLQACEETLGTPHVARVFPGVFTEEAIWNGRRGVVVNAPDTAAHVA
jgi:hypothetical protein